MIPAPDFSEIRGNDAAVQQVAHAVACRVGMILMGPPGTGKTMIARRVPGLLGPLDEHAQRWLTAEYEGFGMLSRASDAITERPFRAPHHTISQAALTGERTRATSAGQPVCRCKQALPAHLFHDLPRAAVPRVGEAQLARFGVLMLDEVCEFTRTALEALASAMRAMGDSAPLIVATANRCPCGWAGETMRECTCTEGDKSRMSARVEKAVAILGIDQVVSVAPVSLVDMRSSVPSVSTAALREQISGAYVTPRDLLVAAVARSQGAL